MDFETRLQSVAFLVADWQTADAFVAEYEVALAEWRALMAAGKDKGAPVYWVRLKSLLIAQLAFVALAAQAGGMGKATN